MEGEVWGSVERRLEEYGSLLGIYLAVLGEVNEGVHQLYQSMAESRFIFLGLSRADPAVTRNWQ